MNEMTEPAARRDPVIRANGEREAANEAMSDPEGYGIDTATRIATVYALLALEARLEQIADEVASVAAQVACR